MPGSLKTLGFDRYDIDARLRPALLVLFPALLVGAAWASQARTLVGGLLGIAVACGGAMLLGRIARRRGQAVQAKHAERWGSRGSAAMLRWSDGHIDGATKARYHRALRAADHVLPTPSAEAENPVAADAAYLGCVTWLLEQTRNKKKFELLAAENIDYGFKRNMLGLRPVAWPILIVAFIANVALGAQHWAGIWDGSASTAGGVGAIIVLAAAAWLWVNEDLVQQASDTFAKRLLSSCDALPERVKRRPVTPSKAAKSRKSRGQI
jgi:hypothetical protein